MLKNDIRSFAKWILLSVVVGLVVGAAGTLFSLALKYATDTRVKYDYLIFALPVGGIAIVWLYDRFCREGLAGTNIVLTTLQNSGRLPARLAPLIAVSTAITHLFGGSSGREGAALQLGGSLARKIGTLLRLKDGDLKIITLAGMSAAFSALFGTPFTAAVFAMEVSRVGVMEYEALVPCAVAALLGSAVARLAGLSGETFTVLSIPNVSIVPMLGTLALGVMVAALSIMFCVTLHMSERLFKRFLKNPYMRVLSGGALVVAITYIFGVRDYNGAGMDVIERAVEGHVKYEAFAVKLLLTALTLGSGYKGGEIVPALFVGATFGCLFGTVIGLSPSLCAAVGMAAMFAGVTNCPLASLALSAELFGMEGMPYYLLAIAVSYMLSGYFGLYHAQRFTLSKYADEPLDISAH